MRLKWKVANPASGKFASGVFGVLFLVIGIGLAGIAIFGIIPQALDGRALSLDGIETTGIILEKIEYTSSRNRPVTSFPVVYEFAAQNDQTYQNTVDVGRTRQNELNIGDEVTIRYLPDDPTNSDLTEAVDSFLGLVIAAFAFFVFGAFFTYIGLSVIASMFHH